MSQLMVVLVLVHYKGSVSALQFIEPLVDLDVPHRIIMVPILVTT